ncbi:MAG: YifB family Mg chelatase-like AAA ATPase [Actinomycetota bacterium]|nr:YifB family Mg chelatase-like AAA ATPase [Actinomycetota bacterium]
MLAAVRSATVFGVEGRPVTVEVHVSTGLPAFQIVGLPDEACRESRDRVRAAVLSSGLVWPSCRVTVNLAPSSQRKGGSGLDLPIAIGFLAAHGQVPVAQIEGLGFVGELGLDGSMRPVSGVAPMVAAMRDVRPVVPTASFREAQGVVGDEVRVAATLREVVDALNAEGPWPRPPEGEFVDDEPPPPDLADVRGQSTARRGLEVAAAGGHHLLLVGPPGSGKTMLAQRMSGLLPALDAETALQATMVHSAAGVRLPAGGLVRRAPFRAPHHSSSMVSLVGGGSTSLRPGEISLSHGGILFLDELGEFAPVVLDGLRQPLEEGVIRLARARASAALPARFLLVAATNPCPCGGGPPGACECDESARLRYLRRLSGPLLDRFDLRVGVHRPGVDDLLATGGGEPTAVVAQRVGLARQRAIDRIGMMNAHIPPSRLDELAPLHPTARQVLREQLEADKLTGRGYHRIRRTARTLADLDGDGELVLEEHVVMAMSMRVRLSVSSRERAA